MLVDGDRTRVSIVLLVATLALLTALAVVGVVPRGPSDPMYFLFSAMLGGNLTLITVVLSINQLVLSRELGSPGTLHQRIRDAVEYRHDVEEVAGSVPSPVSPEGFLRYLHEALTDTATGLEESVSESETERLSGRVGDLVGDLTRDAAAVKRALDEPTTDIFAVIGATLGTDHADQLYEIAEVKAEFEELTDAQQQSLDRLRDQLLYIDTARKYFRTVYMEKELSVLSRMILYVGVPAEVLAAVALAVYGAAGATAATPLWLLPFVLVALTAGFAPLAVLFSFVLRLSWVAQQNTSVAPFSASAEE